MGEEGKVGNRILSHGIQFSARLPRKGSGTRKVLAPERLWCYTFADATGPMRPKASLSSVGCGSPAATCSGPVSSKLVTSPISKQSCRLKAASELR
jgi:hypothetical protein